MESEFLIEHPLINDPQEYLDSLKFSLNYVTIILLVCDAWIYVRNMT